MPPTLPEATVSAGEAFEGASVSAVVRLHKQTRTAAETTLGWAGLELGEQAEVGGAVIAVARTDGDAGHRVTFRVLSGSLREASVGLRLAFDDWSERVHVVMPAAAYGANRYEPTGTWRSEVLEDRGPDPVIIQQPLVPRLELGGGGSLQMMAGDMSVPAVALYFPDSGRGRGRGLILATPQRADGVDLDSVIRVVEASDGGSAVVEVLAAGVRQGERREGFPSFDRGATLAAGDVVTLTVFCRSFACGGVAELHRHLMELRPALEFERLASQTPLLGREVLPFSATWRVQERKFNEQNWVEAHGYYSVGMREAQSQDWQTGWVGGCNTLYPLLADGDALTRRRALRTFDHLMGGRLPSGFLRDRFAEGRWIDSPRVFLRHQADALYFLSKSLLLLREREVEINPAWLKLPRGIAEAFARMWREEGQLGQYADAMTGEIRIGRTCAAGLAPAGLLLAAQLLDEPDWVDLASQIGEYYAKRFTAEGLTNGGPGDIAQAHDSESAFALLASYTHLYEATGDPRWLEIAEDAACQAATYVMPYDFAFPPDSTLGRLGMRTRGTVFANVQNKHSAPGICTLSGVSLLRLARATGDRRWLDLLADIAGAIPQYMSRVDRPIRDRRPGQRWPVMPEGWINERVNTSDWEVRGKPGEEIGVGEIFGGSTWSESAMLLTRVELPGVYVHRDRGWCVALDHVRARLDARCLHLENPTPHDAWVKIMIEDDAASDKPLGSNPLAGRRGVLISAHETLTLDLNDRTDPPN